jgi:PIN domain nuclease of toxin-antitoxin system
MIHVDTHVLVWAAAGQFHRMPPGLVACLDRSPVIASPMALLELTYLHEIGRLTVSADEIVEMLRRGIDFRVAEQSFPTVAARAVRLTWTRNPFDRLIAASALIDDLPLFTADTTLLANCAVARWET